MVKALTTVTTSPACGCYLRGKRLTMNKAQDMVRWIPRVLGVAMVLFLGMFASDAFQGDASIGDKVLDSPDALDPCSALHGRGSGRLEARSDRSGRFRIARWRLCALGHATLGLDRRDRWCVVVGRLFVRYGMVGDTVSCAPDGDPLSNRGIPLVGSDHAWYSFNRCKKECLPNRRHSQWIGRILPSLNGCGRYPARTPGSGFGTRPRRPSSSPRCRSVR